MPGALHIQRNTFAARCDRARLINIPVLRSNHQPVVDSALISASSYWPLPIDPRQVRSADETKQPRKHFLRRVGEARG